MKNKKLGIIIGIIAFIIAFAAALLVFLPKNEDALPKDFTYEEMTITLTEKFEKSVDDPKYSVSYTDTFVMVMVLREGFELMEGFENYTLAEYGQVIISNSGQDTELLEDEAGTYFEYTTNPDGNDYHYVYYLYKSQKAFYMIGFATVDAVKDDYRDDILKYARSVRFEGNSADLTPEATTVVCDKHTYGEWETVKEPDCGNEGEKKRACTVCGSEETKSIPKEGEHTFMLGGKCKICKAAMDSGFKFTLSSDGKGYAFSYSGDAKKVKVPEAFNGKPVTGIREYGFMHNNTLEEVILPDSITSIGASAFNGCSNLKKINVPKSLTSIGNYSFSGCYKLSSFEIPETVTRIELGTFANCEKLKVKLHNKLTYIGKEAFNSCNISSLTIPANVSFIGEHAFAYCDIITLTIEEGTKLTEIGEGVFAHNEDIKSFVVPEGIRTIGKEAFSFNGLTSVTLPKSLETIGYRAFYYGENDITVKYSGSEADWQKVSVDSLFVKATANVTYVFAE